MHIIIMGCGRVESSLAILLEKRGHDVSVIDIDDNSFRRLGPDFKGRTVKGVGFDRSVLEKAGIREADGFAAVSSGDNSNVLSARVVREEFGIDNVVAAETKREAQAPFLVSGAIGLVTVGVALAVLYADVDPLHAAALASFPALTSLVLAYRAFAADQEVFK